MRLSFAGCLQSRVSSNSPSFFFGAPGASVTIPTFAASVAFWAHSELRVGLVPGRVTHTTSPCSMGWAAYSARKANEAFFYPTRNVLGSKSAHRFLQAAITDATNKSLHISARKTNEAFFYPTRNVLVSKSAHRLLQAAITDATNKSLSTSARKTDVAFFSPRAMSTTRNSSTGFLFLQGPTHNRSNFCARHAMHNRFLFVPARRSRPVKCDRGCMPQSAPKQNKGALALFAAPNCAGFAVPSEVFAKSFFGKMFCGSTLYS